jgi:exopolyphosphatase / guanosine-5'-triphosphate,3'-diphosphate pyrophosphatase
MQKIAAIDAGSNAIRLIVGEVKENGQVEPIENIRLPVRLGQDAFTTGFLREETIQQGVDAFLHFRRVADDFGVTKIRAIATSALRETSNSHILLDRIQQTSDIEIEIINGEEEARLIHLAVESAIELGNKRAVLIDIGGGSVEVTISENKKIISTESYNMGTVRLLKKLNGEERPTASKRPFSLLVREYAEAARRRIDREIGKEKIHLCIGTGGNVEEMGKLRQRLFKKSSDNVITLSELQDLIEELSGMSVKERIRKLNLKPDRADVILPAAVVLQLIANEARVKEIQIPNVGLKDGLLIEMAEELARDPKPRLLRMEQVWEAAVRLGDKYQLDMEHAALISRLAGQLFDQAKDLHKLDDEYKLLLQVGSLLHDIGHFINPIDHDKHGYYVLKHNPLIGLNEHQQEIIANLVRYHRKDFPSLEDTNFKALPQKDRLIVTKLSALLRLADVMDISHSGRVARVELVEKKKIWTLALHGRGDLMLEKWGLNKRRGLFEEVFGVGLAIAEVV